MTPGNTETPARECPACKSANPFTEIVCVECGGWIVPETPVVFRWIPAGQNRKEPEVVALLPETPWGDNANFCVGHFSWATGGIETHYARTMRKSRAAGPGEYEYLKGYLEGSLGYRFLVVSRATPAMNRLRIQRAAEHKSLPGVNFGGTT